jgi:N-acetylneuraminate synthase
MTAESFFIDINGRKVGGGHPAYIIAELSANHRQEFAEAIELVRKAKEAGADAVKLQTYTPDTMTIRSSSEKFVHGNDSLWAGKSLYDLYKEAYMPWEWYPKLRDAAADLAIDIFSTAFDPSAVDFLEKMDVPVHKVASYEIVDIPLIEKMARTGKPVIISTGMATIAEILEAIEAARNAGARQIAVLKCTSAYPAPPEEMNLLTIPHLRQIVRGPVGLSDHTLGIAVPVAAVALGASIVEKHFTLSRDIPTLDGPFSLDPREFKAMVDAIRVTERSLGTVHYGVNPIEAKSRQFRRSLFVVSEMRAGEDFTVDNVRPLRPALGLHPHHLKDILGRRASRNISRGTPLTWDLVNWGSD